VCEKSVSRCITTSSRACWCTDVCGECAQYEDADEEMPPPPRKVEPPKNNVHTFNGIPGGNTNPAPEPVHAPHKLQQQQLPVDPAVLQMGPSATSSASVCFSLRMYTYTLFAAWTRIGHLRNGGSRWITRDRRITSRLRPL